MTACTRCCCPVDAGDLRCPVCTLRVPLEAHTAKVAEVHIQRCRDCGAGMELLLRGVKTNRVSFPVYVLAYRYRNEVHRALICGQDAETVFAVVPLSRFRVAVAILVGILVGAMILHAAL